MQSLPLLRPYSCMCTLGLLLHLPASAALNSSFSSYYKELISSSKFPSPSTSYISSLLNHLASLYHLDSAHNHHHWLDLSICRCKSFTFSQCGPHLMLILLIFMQWDSSNQIYQIIHLYTTWCNCSKFTKGCKQQYILAKLIVYSWIYTNRYGKIYTLQY